MKNYLRAVLLVLPEVISKGTSFLAIFLLGRIFLPEHMGIYAKYSAMIGLLIPIVTFNLGGGMVRFHIVNKANYLRGIILNYFPQIIILTLLSILFAFLIDISFLLVSVPFLIILSDYIKGMAIYRKKDLNLVVLSLVNSAVLVCLYLSAGSFKGNLWSFVVLTIFTAPLVVTTIGYALAYHKGMYSDGAPSNTIKDVFRYSLPTIPRSYAGRLMNNFDRLVGAYAFGEAFNGLYAINYGLAFSGMAIVEVFTRFYYPRYLESRELTGRGIVYMANVKYILGFSLIILCFYPVITFLFPFVFKRDYNISQYFFLLWLINVAFLVFRSLDVEFIFNGKSKYSLFSYGVGLVTNLLLLYLSYIFENELLFYLSTLAGYVSMICASIVFIRYVEKD